MPFMALQIDGEKLKLLRDRQALSQKALGELAGVGQDTISSLENEKHRAFHATVRKLANALKVEPVEILK